MRKLHRSRRAPACVPLAMVLLCLAPPSRAAVAQKDIAAVNGDQTRLLLGIGKGVTVGIIDGGVDVTHPAIRSAVVASKDFTSDKTTADTGGAHRLGHGTGVAGLVAGNDTAGGYTGLAPAAKLVNARVAGVNGIATDGQIGDGLFWAVSKGAQVVNLSIGQDGKSPVTNKLNLMLDYVAERYGTLVVVAAKNQPNASAVADAPGGQYNGLTVGATGGKHFDVVDTNTGYSLPSDARTKPDLVAPGDNVSLASANWSRSSDYYAGTGTSFATPIVGGVIAQMVGYGKSHSLSTDPLVLKSVLLASALHVSFPDGTGWVARGSVNDPVDGVTMTRPLDDSQGAGRVDALGAYQIYARKTDSTVKSANWKRVTLAENTSYTLKLGNLKAGDRIDTAITWLHHVVQTGKGSSAGAGTYTEAASLADFSLTLLRDGKRMIMSDDKANNVEYLSQVLTRSGDYSIEVYRYAGSGIKSEPFALAERVLQPAVTKRGRATPALVREERPFAVTAGVQGVLRSSEVTAVPEPGSGAAVLALSAFLTLRRRRRIA